MLKNKNAFEMNRARYIEAGKRDADQKHKFRKATRPNNKSKLH